MRTLGRALTRVKLLLCEMDITGNPVYGESDDKTGGHGKIHNQVQHFERHLETVGYRFLACAAGADSVQVVPRERAVPMGWRAVHHSVAPGRLSVHMREAREVPLERLLKQDGTVHKLQDYHTNALGEKFRYRWVHCVMAPQ